MKFSSLELKNFLMQDLLPRWSKIILDENRGYHEKLDKNQKPIDIPYKRLHGQCRNIYVFSQAALFDEKYIKEAKIGFNFIKNYFDSSSNTWYFKVDKEGNLFDEVRDLYATSFVILACAFYYKASKDQQALDLAKRTLEGIRTNYSINGAYCDSLKSNTLEKDKSKIRQNPHMHLFEACLFMYDFSKDEIYLKEADKLFNLFSDSFYVEGTLREYLSIDLKCVGESSKIIEPGHHFEWAWLLLKKNSIISDERLEVISRDLVSWSENNGFDKEYGGIFDEVFTSGEVKSDKKRIWIVTEALKAYGALWRNTKEEKFKEKMEEMLELLFSNYISKKPFSWKERLNKDLSVYDNNMPSTSVYHIFLALVETIKVLEVQEKL